MGGRQAAGTRDSRVPVPRALTDALALIQRKRDGAELADAEMRDLVLAYARDGVPDYQMAAFLMAVFFRGLTRAGSHPVPAREASVSVDFRAVEKITKEQ